MPADQASCAFVGTCAGRSLERLQADRKDASFRRCEAVLERGWIGVRLTLTDGACNRHLREAERDGTGLTRDADTYLDRLVLAHSETIRVKVGDSPGD